MWLARPPAVLSPAVMLSRGVRGRRSLTIRVLTRVRQAPCAPFNASPLVRWKESTAARMLRRQCVVKAYSGGQGAAGRGQRCAGLTSANVEGVDGNARIHAEDYFGGRSLCSFRQPTLILHILMCNKDVENESRNAGTPRDLEHC
jgi:hypothetical protein